MNSSVKAVFFYAVFSILLLNILGCATARQGNRGLEMQRLQMRVSELEKRLQEKEEEIYGLENELMKTKKTKTAKKTSDENPKTLACTAKNIQTALKNAGFYKGPVDGKIGKGTKRAIKDFQNAHGLSADGVVGKKTWSVLAEYLSR